MDSTIRFMDGLLGHRELLDRAVQISFFVMLAIDNIPSETLQICERQYTTYLKGRYMGDNIQRT